MRSNFIERLKELMEEHGLKNKDMVAITNLSKVNDVYPWLNGENYPSLSNMIKLADYFQCSLEYLMGRTEDNSVTTFKECPPFYDQVVKVLKQRRKKKVDLSRARICYGSHFQKWKTLNAEPNIETVIKLADYFNVSIDYMVGRE